MPPPGEPPAAQPSAALAPPPQGPDKHVTRGVGVILIIALLQLLVGGFRGYTEAAESTKQLDVLSSRDASEMVVVEGDTLSVGEARLTYQVTRILTMVIPPALGLLFLALYLWGRRRPHPALWLTLVLFVGLHGLQAWHDPSTLMRGLAFKLPILAALMLGLSSYSGTNSQEESDAQATV